MKQAVMKTKKFLAVLMCIFMLSSLALPLAGAEDVDEIISNAIEIIVPTEAEGTKTEYIDAAKMDGATYSLCTDTEGNVLESSEIYTAKDEPKVTVKNSLKEFVFKNGGECIVYLGAFTETEKKFVALKLKNYEVSVAFYADGADEPLVEPIKVVYGGSVKDAADAAAAKIEITYNKYYHYAFSEWAVSEGNSESKVDKVLSDTKFTAVIAPALHVFDKVVEEIPATCTAEGSKTLGCICGATETEVLPIVPHTFEKENEEHPYTKTEATCTEDGIESGYCTTCEQNVIIKTGKLGHNMVVVKAMKVATCEEDGWTNREECTRCDHVVESKVIEKLGHNPVEIPAVEPTCTENGHGVGEKCARCKKVLTEPEVIPSKGGHKMENVEAKDATCTEDGNTAGEKCAVCGYTEDVEIIKAIGHDWEIVKEAKEPTCTEPGWTEEKYCKVCNEIVKSEDVEATGHTEVIDPETEATCTEPKMSEGKHCSVCNAVLVAQEPIGEALGHDWVVDESAIPATCTEPGKTEAKHCKRCDAKAEPEETALLPHEYEIVEGKEDIVATCTEDGLKAERKCKNCDAMLEEEVIPALGHIDEDNNNACDRCGAEITHIDPSANCSCICHSDNVFKKFLWEKILLPIIKFLGVEKNCKCGVEHWSK